MVSYLPAVSNQPHLNLRRTHRDFAVALRAKDVVLFQNPYGALVATERQYVILNYHQPMVRLSLTWLAAAASVFGLLYTIWPTEHPLTGMQGAIVALLGFIFLLAAYADIRDHLHRQPKRYKSEADINAYMFRWISKSGRAVVFTRDHTWAREPKIRDLLFAKARRNELAICLPADTDLTLELQSEGAEIIAYPQLAYTPGARFTIINDGRIADAAVAIGRQIDGVQVIEEFPASDPVFAVTKDLVEVLRRIVA